MRNCHVTRLSCSPLNLILVAQLARLTGPGPTASGDVKNDVRLLSPIEIFIIYSGINCYPKSDSSGARHVHQPEQKIIHYFYIFGKIKNCCIIRKSVAAFIAALFI